MYEYHCTTWYPLCLFSSFFLKRNVGCTYQTTRGICWDLDREIKQGLGNICPESVPLASQGPQFQSEGSHVRNIGNHLTPSDSEVLTGFHVWYCGDGCKLNVGFCGRTNP
jgi:hypothetical protein